MKDVYEDMEALESYIKSGHAEAGISLVMNDMERLVKPKNKDSKCWHYDISHGAIVGPITLTTPIGGKQIKIT